MNASARRIHKPEAFEGGDKDVLLSSLNSGEGEQAGITLTATETHEELAEINAVV
jgi:hypothetical protein